MRCPHFDVLWHPFQMEIVTLQCMLQSAVELLALVRNLNADRTIQLQFVLFATSS